MFCVFVMSKYVRRRIFRPFYSLNLYFFDYIIQFHVFVYSCLLYILYDYNSYKEFNVCDFCPLNCPYQNVCLQTYGYHTILGLKGLRVGDYYCTHLLCYNTYFVP